MTSQEANEISRDYSQTNMAMSREKHQQQQQEENEMTAKDTDDIATSDEVSPIQLCPDCKKAVKHGNKGLTCDICQNWFHVNKKCQKVSDTVYKAIEDEDNEQLHWYCSHCNLGASSVLQMISKVNTELSGKIDDVNRTVSKNHRETTKKIAEINNGMEVLTNDHDGRLRRLETKEKTESDIEQQLVDLTHKVDELTKPGSTITDGKPNANNVALIEKKLQELREEDKRKNNIIIYKMQESTETEGKKREDDDRNAAMDLFRNILEVTNIEDTNITKVVRLGAKNDNKEDEETKMRPLMIGFENYAIKTQVLKNSGRLKDASKEYNDIVLKHDMTKTQREKQRELTTEAKKRESADDSGNYRYRVRGPPGALVIRKFPKK